MHASCLATVCLVADERSSDLFQRCLASLLQYTPLEKMELRLGFQRRPDDFHYALGCLFADGGTPTHGKLPGGIARFQGSGRHGSMIRVWNSSAGLSRAGMMRLLYHDVALETDYAICLAEDAIVESGWWDSLSRHLTEGVDYLGQQQWHEYRDEHLEIIQAHPWYMGVPFDQRDGKLGVSFMAGGLTVVRSARLKEANFPELCVVRQPEHYWGCEVLLGEIARQLGWKQAYVRGTNSDERTG